MLPDPRRIRPSRASAGRDESRTSRGHELVIDWIRCDGYGLCGDLAPDLIGLDDWRYPILPRGGQVPPHLVDSARRVVDCCPARALALRRAGSGRRG